MNIMDTMNEELYNIENNILLLFDDSQYKAELTETLERLRKEFESGFSVRYSTMSEIINLSAILELYAEGVTESPIRSKKDKLPEFPIKQDSVERREIIKANNNIEILNGYAKRIDFDSDIENIKTAIEDLQAKYNVEPKKYSQVLEQSIAEAKYKLMIKYLQNGKIAEAEEYSQTFGKSMRVYIVKKFKDKISTLTSTLTSEGKLVEALKLNEYIYGKNIKENDLELWGAIAQIESPEIKIDISSKTEKIEEAPKELPKMQKKGNTIQQKIEDMQYERKYGIKVFRVRHDPQNEGTGINQSDVEKIKKFTNNKNQKYKVVFEEGIKSISGLEDIMDEKNKVLRSKNMIGVELPATVENIEASAFSGSGLEYIDLSSTKIKSVPSACFSGCHSLHKVELPANLKYLGERAFANSGIESIDMSDTSVTVIDAACFLRCKHLKNVKLSKTLKSLYSGGVNIYSGEIEGIFEESGIEHIDFSQTQILEIPENCFYECKALKTVKMPETPACVGQNAFYGTELEKRNRAREDRQVDTPKKHISPVPGEIDM